MFLVFLFALKYFFCIFTFSQISDLGSSAKLEYYFALTVVAEVSEGSLRNRLSSVVRELLSKARGF